MSRVFDDDNEEWNSEKRFSDAAVLEVEKETGQSYDGLKMWEMMPYFLTEELESHRVRSDRWLEKVSVGGQESAKQL